MAERRPSRGRGPGGSRGPASARSRPRAGQSAGGPSRNGRTGPVRCRPRPKLTGRAAILVLVLAVLTISYASSLRAYLQQRSHIADLHEQIDRSSNAIDELEREKRRWDDESYVKMQARERFNYVMPGEKSYRILDENGDPLESDDSLSDPDDLPERVPDPWWQDAWHSVELAGNPPDENDGPAETIRGARDK